MSRSILFESGFETGDFSGWNGIHGTPTVVTEQAHHGLYSMYVTGTGPDDIWKSIVEQTTLFTRVYIRLNSPMPDYTTYELFQFNKGYTPICRMRLYHSTGTNYYLQIFRWIPYSDTSSSIQITIAPGEWHSFEMKFVRDAVNGEFRSYYDGVEKGVETGLDTSGVTGADVVYVGNVEAGSADYHVDCVVIANTGPIGPEVTWTLTIDSSPIAGVPITVDGSAVGSTPISITISEGSHTIQVPPEVMV